MTQPLRRRWNVFSRTACQARAHRWQRSFRRFDSPLAPGRSSWTSIVGAFKRLLTQSARRQKNSAFWAFRTPQFELLEDRTLLAVRVWDGGGGDTNWNTAANWSSDIAPLAGDNLIFPAGVTQLASNNNLPAGTTFNTIQFTGAGYNITGNAIQLAGGLTANNTTGANNFGLDVTLLNAQTVMNANPASSLILTGAIHTGNLIGTTAILGTSALIFDGAGTTTVSGAIDGGGSLTKYGGGMLVLDASNSYEGITDARQGVIRVTNDNGLGLASSGETQVQAGAAVELSGVTTGEHFAIREGGVGFGEGTDPSSLGALRGVGGTTSTVTGNIDLIGGNNLIGVSAGSTLIIDGVVANGIASTNRLIKVGPGTLQLAGSEDNVYRGETRALQGVLELNKSPGKNAIGGSLLIGDNIGGDNAATVKLLADDQIPHVDFFGVALTTTTLNSSGLLDLGGNSDTIGNLVLTTGTTYSADVTTGGGTLTLGGASLTLTAAQGSSPVSPPATISGKLDLGTFFSGSGGGTTKTFNIANTALASVDADLVIDADISGAADVSLTRTGTGALTLAGNNTYAGPTILNTNGVTRIASDSAFGTGLLSIQNNSAVLRAAAAPRTVANPVSLDSNFAVRGSNNLTFTGLATLTGSRTITVFDAAQTTTFAGGVTEGIYGSLNLAKSGRGTLALTLPASYSGTTTLNVDGGTLLLVGGGAIPNSSSFTVNEGAILRLDNSGTMNLGNRIHDAAPITLNGGELKYVSADGAASTEMVGTITAGGNYSSTIDSETTGTGTAHLISSALTIGGGGTINFVGTNDDLSAGGDNRVSFVNAPAALDDGIVPASRVRGPAGIDFATYESSDAGIAIVPLPAAAYVTDISQASVTSNVRLAAGTYTLTTSKSLNSLLLDNGAILNGPGVNVTINSGAVLLGNNSQINTAVLTMAATAYVTTVPGASATISSQIVGAATALTKAGTGTLILTGDNQYAGATNVNAGALNIQRSSALGSSAGATNIRSGAALELQETSFGPVHVGLETLNLAGTGIDDTGALRNVAGSDNSWAGNVPLTGVSLDGPSFFPSTNAIIASAAIVSVDSGKLNLSGVISNNVELFKVGGGTLELSGIASNTANASTRVKEGTLLLNKEPGLTAVLNTTFFVGDDDGLGAPAILRWAAADQIPDNVTITVASTGSLDLNGFADVIGGLVLTVGPEGGSSVSLGEGMLTLGGNITVQQIGADNPAGAMISGGTLALQLFGANAAASARTVLVNDGAAGDDLTITSAIVDGTGLQSMGITKTGFGSLVFSGSTPNTYTGTTSINEGTLVLDKGSGVSGGGVSALSGPVTIGNNDVTSGFANSDVLRLNRPDQIPDYLAAITVNTTGLFDLNGKGETIGNVDAQNALVMQAGSTVQLGGATLRINGNVNSNSANGAGLWTPVVAPQIVNGTIDLGAVGPTFDLSGDRTELPYELLISADIIGTGGLLLANSSTLLLSGDNSGLSGDVIRTNGNFAVGSDTALGTGRVLINAGHLTTYGGKRTLNNEFLLAATTISFIGGNNTAGSSTIGGGGNDLTFAGPVNVNAGNFFPAVPVAGQVEFAGGLGENFGSVFTRKQGFGTMIVSSPATLSGNLEIGQDNGGSPSARVNGGHLVIRDQGTWLNGNLLVGVGGVLEIDNSGVALSNRVGDTALVDIYGGTLALVGKPGTAVTESFGQLRPRNNWSGFVQSLVPDAPGSSALWRFTSLAREAANQGSTVQIIGRGTDITADGVNRVALNSVTGLLTNAIVPFAVLQNSGGLDFVTVTNAAPLTTPGNNFLGPLTSGSNFATTLAGASDTVNVKLSGSESVGSAVNANALLLAGGGITVSGGGSLTLGSGLLASSGAGNTVSVTDLTLGTTEGNVYVAAGDVNVSSNLAGATSILANGGPGTVVLSGDNTFTGIFRVVSGTLQAASDTAFGTTAGGVTVTYGGTLELAGVDVPAKTLNLSGNGESNVAAVSLRAVGGSSTWEGNIVLNNNRTGIDVADGSSLTIGTPSVGGVLGANGFNKIGLGTLQLAGNLANTLSQPSYVWQGTLELNKSGGVNAITSQLIVGDDVGAGNTDVVRLLQSNQFADSGNPTVRVNSTGFLDLNGNSESFVPGANQNSLELQYGPTSSASVTTGSGTLTLGSTGAFASNINVTGVAGGFPAPTSISGNLAFTASAAQTITVADSAGVNDLVISATISGTQNVTKAGTGRIVLSGDNGTYAGSVTVNGGELVVQHANALGNATGNTIVNSGFSLLIDGVTVAGEPLSINGNGFGGQGAVRNIAGSNTWTGAVTLAGNSIIGVDAGTTLNVAAAIGGTTGITKLLPGTLVYSGTANTYSGTTTVNEGTLVLNKAAAVNAIAGPLVIGNDAGPDNSDRVVLANNDQILDTQAVTINSTGQLDLRRTTVATTQQVGGGNNEIQAVTANPGSASFTLAYNDVSSSSITSATADGAAVQAALVAIPALAGNVSVSGPVGGPWTVTFINVLANTDVAQLVPSGYNERLAAATALTMTFAPNSSANVNSGAGVLTLGGNVAVNQATGTTLTSESIGAEIGGNLNLGNAARTFTIALNALLPNEARLSAVVNGGGASGSIVKAGTGSLSILQDNSAAYSGTTNLSSGNLSLGHDMALGTGTLNVTNTAATSIIRSRQDTGPRNIANPVTLNANLQVGGNLDFTFGGLVTQVGAARTITLNPNNGAAVDFAGGINLGGAFALTIAANTFNATHSVSGTIVNGTGTGALTKSGAGTLVLANSNSYTGVTTVAAGILQVTDNGALGANGSISTNQTTVNNGATLAVGAGLTLPEWLVLNNNGFGNFGALRLMDALPGVTETATVSGNVNFNATAFVGVDGGGANPDRIVFTGIQNSGSGLTTKVGAGEIEFAGTGDNVTFTGGPSNFDDGLEVRAGTVYFNKTGANRVILGGTINVGDGGCGDNADKLILIGSGTDQIGGNLNVVVRASGQLLFGDSTSSESIGTLTLERLSGIAGDVDTSGGMSTPTLILTNTLTVNNAGVTTGATPAATVSGNLNMSGTRSFTVNDSFAQDSAEDLVVSALLSNGLLQKDGYGTMAVTNGANSYVSGTTVNSAALDFNASYNHGLTFPLSGTLIARAGGVLGTGNVTVNSGGTLILDNTSVNADRITDVATLTLAGGTLNLIGNAGGTTEVVTTLTINAGDNTGKHAAITVDSSAGGVTILEATSLTRGGGAAAHFTGIGDELGNTTTSRIQIDGGTNPFVNGVLPWATISGPANPYDLVTDADGSAAAAPYFMGRVTSYNGSVNSGGVVRLSGGTDTLTANRVVDGLLLENGATIDGAFTLQIGTGTAGVVAVRSGTNLTAAATRLDFGNRNPMFLIETDSSLEVAGNLTGSAELRKERGGTLILSGDNDQGAGLQFTGETAINAGRLIARHSDAFGTTAGDVNIGDRGQLVLDGNLTIGNEILRLRGTGLNNDYSGAVQVTGGNVSWGTGTTAVNYDTNSAFIFVDTGSTWTLNANVGGGGNPMIKRGAGELIYAGTGDNGNTGAVTVNAGTVTLNKPGTSRAIRGTLTIDDLGNFDDVDAATVQYAATAGTNNIDDGVSIVVNHQGSLDFNGINDTINALTINGASVITGTGMLTENGALTITGGSFTGNLVLNNNLTYNSGLATSGAAGIAGGLDLGGGTRTFTVNDAYFVNDLTVSALISNGTLTKAGNGTLLLSNGGNSFAGGVNLGAGTLALGDKAALGSGTLNVTANSVLRADGVDLVGANAVPNAVTYNLPNNQTLTLGGRRDFDGTDGIELSGAGTLRAPTAAETLFLSVIDPQVTAVLSGPIGGGNNNLILGKTGIGTLVMSANNTFDVRDTVLVGGNPVNLGQAEGIRIDAGVLRITDSGALGAGGTANVNVRGDLGAALEIDGSAGDVNLTGRNLILFHPDNNTGFGFLNRNSDPTVVTGVLRNVAGNNSVTGQIDLRNIANNGNAGTIFIGVDAGSLDLIGQVIGSRNDGNTTTTNNRNLNKIGSGVLRYSGTTANTITGNTSVIEGMLELNKTPDQNAIAGPLFVGDNVGAAGSDTVKFLADNQILDTVAVTVGTSGLWNLNDFSGGLTGLTTLILGDSAAGSIDTGTGTLAIGSVTATPRPGITSAVSATIDGKLSMAATSTYTVNDSPADVELTVNATISETAAAGLTKTGAGRMLLSPVGTNSYTGAVLVSGGVLRITSDSSLGTDAGGTTVNSGTSLELVGGFIEAGEALTIAGTGIIDETRPAVFNSSDRGQAAIGTGALRSVSGANEWQGSVILLTNSTNAISVDAESLVLSGVVSSTGGNGHLLKSGAGTLEFGGDSSNTYNGNTYVNDGLLLLNKSGTAVAIDNGEIVVGDNVGGDKSDVLQLAATAGINQIGDQTIRMAGTGWLNLNGVTETNNAAIWLTVDAAASSDVSTGAGVLIDNNVITVVSRAGATAGSPPATFTGTYDLNGGTRNIDVRRGGALVEFEIAGVIQVTGNFGINKLGEGRLRLSDTNTYVGTTSVNAGVLEVGSDGALGTTAAGTTVASVAALEFKSANPLTVAETFNISGDGWGDTGSGALNSISPADVTLTGAITVSGVSYQGTSTIGNHSPGTTLTLQGNTTMTSSPLANLVFNGDGDISVPAVITGAFISAPYFSAFEGRLFLATGQGVNNTNINNLVPGGSTVPAVTATLNGALNFPQDSDVAFTTFFGGQPGSAAFTAVFFGTVTVDTTGTYYFAITNNDDTAAVWVDTDGSNSFDAGELVHSGGCCNNTGFGSRTLNAGTYNIAYAVEDTGGGSGLTGRFQPGSWGVPASGTAMPIVSTIIIGNVIKDDAGTLTLSSGNSYSDTTVNGGKLLANNTSGSATGGGSVTVNNAATLGGTGTIAGPVLINNVATLSPGDPATTNPQSLATGDLTLSGGEFDVQIDADGGTTAGTSNDVIYVTGSVALGNGVAKLNVASLGNAPAVANYILIDNDGSDPTTGYFLDSIGNNLNDGDTLNIGALTYRIFYNSGDGNDVVVFGPVPRYDFTAATFTAPEGNSTNTTNVVTVTRSNQTSIATSVDVVLTGTTATAGSDFTAGPITINFGIGQNTQTVPIQILGDVTVELNEDIGLSFANFSNSGQAGTTNPTSTLTITNDDSAVVSINAPSAGEGSPLGFVITINNPVDVAVTANRATQDGTATTADNDYTPLALGNVTLFAAGSTAPFSITVNTIQDNRLELDETLYLVMSNLSAGGRDVTFNGGALTLAGTGTIQDDDIGLIDDRDPSPAFVQTGFTNFGKSTLQQPQGFRGDVHYLQGLSPAGKATWTFTSLPTGFYRVSATWSAHSNRATDSPFRVYNGADVGTPDAISRFNQKIAPNDFQDLNVGWEDITGGVFINTGTLTVTLQNDIGNPQLYVIADAIRIESVAAAPEIELRDESGSIVETSVSLGTTLEGGIARHTITVNNVGPATLNLSSLSVSGDAQFSLDTTATATTLAGGASTTFDVVLDTAVAGSYTGQVTVNSNDTDENPLQFNVAGVINDTLIVDNRDPAPAFVQTGFTNYGTATAQQPQGYLGNVHYLAGSSPAGKATWTFSGLPDGYYDIWATWPAQSNRATDSPFKVYVGLDDGTPDAEQALNQQLAPNDLIAAGVGWETVSGLQVTGGTLTVTLDNAIGDKSKFVIADAIRIQRNDPSGLVPEIEVLDGSSNIISGGIVLPNVEIGAVVIETITIQNLGTGQLNLSAISIAGDGQFSLDTTGTDLTLPAGQSTTFDVLLDTSAANVYNATVSIFSNDGDENPLEFTVQATVDPSPPPASNTWIIDNGDAGFSAPKFTAFGVGGVGQPQGYQGDLHFHAPAPQGVAVATWTFDNLDPGTYQVAITWTEHTNRSNDATFTVSGTTNNGTAHVNQRLAPSSFPGSFADEGVFWAPLNVGGSGGNFLVAGSTLTVKLGTSVYGYVIADAVRIEKLQPLLAVGEELISDRWSVANSASTLDAATVSHAVNAAVAQWSAVDTTAMVRLANVRVEVANLPGNVLGLASESTNRIWLDTNAAGHGWNVSGALRVESREIDLLTVVTHELGHVLGLPDVDPIEHPYDVMAGRVSTGSSKFTVAGYDPVPNAAAVPSLSRAEIADRLFDTFDESVDREFGEALRPASLRNVVSSPVAELWYDRTFFQSDEEEELDVLSHDELQKSAVDALCEELDAEIR